MLRLVLSLTVLLAAAPAWGQTTATSAPPIQAAPAADAPSKEQIDAALDLLKANNSAGNMTAALDTMLPIEAVAIKREHPDADDAVIQKLLGVVRETVKTHADELVQIYAISYARHFSIDEMHTLAAFYRSDVGQKYIQSLPVLMKEVTPTAVSYIQKLIIQSVQDTIAHMRAQGEKI